MSRTPPKQTPDVPGHIAIIMDGNGRWARRRGRRRTTGHRAGARRVREITTECARIGVGQLTLYALSAENYARRSRTEIRTLMSLLRRYMVDERPTLMDNRIRLRTIGRLVELPRHVMAEVRKTEGMTAQNERMTLCLAVNYGGRAELADAARGITREVEAGRLTPDDVTEETVARHVYTAGMPDVDLVIRTAGEMRISNFLLWQAWYAELYVTEVLWPDFGPAALRGAIDAYARRDRKFGAVRPRKGGRAG